MLRRDPSGGLWPREALPTLNYLLQALSARFARFTTLITDSTSNCLSTGNFKKLVQRMSISTNWLIFSAKNRPKDGQ